MNYTILLIITIVIFSLKTFSQISGTHTIGTGGEFLTFTEAINYIENQGVSDTLLFVIKSGTYTEQVAIDGSLINYINGIKPINFISETANTDDVVLRYSADTINNYTLKIKDITNLTIEGITIQALDTTYARVVVFDNFVDSTYIINNKIIGTDSVGLSDLSTCVYLKTLNTDSIMYISFSGNEIVNGTDGISSVDNNLTLSNLKLLIKNNIFLSQKNNPIHISNKNTIITENIINSDYALCGISGVSLDTFLISKNKITLFSVNSKAINIYGTANIYNNFISIINGNYGIWCNGNTNILNNTILLKNTNYSSVCIENNNTSMEVVIKNNCLVNIDGDKIFNNFFNDYSNWDVDYNNLYSISSYFNFNDLVSTVGGNIHSVSFMPDFVSVIDLHTNSTLLYQTGVNLPEISDDIDGQTRNNPPCIGADEFTNPVFNNQDTIFCYYTDNNNTIGNYIYDIGLGYDTYHWSNGSDSSSIVIDTLNSVIGNNQYAVTVTVGSNTYTDTINIMYDLPAAISQTDYCVNLGDSITIWAEPNLTYLWNYVDTTQYYNLLPYSIPNLTVTDIYGCKNSVSIYTEVTMEPAQIYIDDLNDQILPYICAPTDTFICSDEIIGLIANNYFGVGVYDHYSFLWNTGDTTNTIAVDSAHYGIGVHEFSVIVTNLETGLQCETYDTVFVEIKNCNGIKLISKNDINIYPNPANNIITISNKQSEIVCVTIDDMTGKKIKQIDFDNIKYANINVSDLQDGVYIFKVLFKDDLYKIKYIIVNHQ